MLDRCDFQYLHDLHSRIMLIKGMKFLVIIEMAASESELTSRGVRRLASAIRRPYKIAKSSTGQPLCLHIFS